RMAQRFGKAEKLKSRKWIEQIFAEGKTIKAFPILAVFKNFEATDGVAVKAGFSVSKRKFRNAVDRNLLKRRMRESYRLQKHRIIDPVEPEITRGVMFVYMAGKGLKFEEINKAFEKVLTDLKNLKG
ncbi:MAG: ribonuclease P protein component, partial [Owenweeksia sp.]